MTVSIPMAAFGDLEERDYSFDGAALPDVLANFTRANGCTGGVKALMVAVFEDGIRCFMSPEPLARAEAEAWVNSNERGYVFAFLTVCDALDLNGNAVREALQANRERTGFVARRAIRTRPNVRRHQPLRPNRRRNRSRAGSSPRKVDEPMRDAASF